MPIFDYQCTRCAEVFEHLLLGDELPECPGCNSLLVDKMLSRTARPQFRGTGFYETDYKKKTPTNE